MSHYDRILSSRPLNRSAAVVTGGGDHAEQPPSLSEKRHDLIRSLRSVDAELPIARGYRRVQLREAKQSIVEQLQKVTSEIKENNVRRSSADTFAKEFKQVVYEAVGEERFLEFCQAARERMTDQTATSVLNDKE